MEAASVIAMLLASLEQQRLNTLGGQGVRFRFLAHGWGSGH